MYVKDVKLIKQLLIYFPFWNEPLLMKTLICSRPAWNSLRFHLKQGAMYNNVLQCIFKLSSKSYKIILLATEHKRTLPFQNQKIPNGTQYNTHFVKTSATDFCIIRWYCICVFNNLLNDIHLVNSCLIFQ